MIERIASIFPFIIALASLPVSAGTITAHTAINAVDDSQGPLGAGAVNVFNTDPAGDDFNFDPSAFAHAAGNADGDAAVRAEGLYACGACTFDLIADTTYTVSHTNDSGASVSFDYDYFIDSLVVELVDYGGHDQGDGLFAYAGASIEMMTTGGAGASVLASMLLYGGDVAHSVDVVGAAPVFSTDGSIFGYTMAPLSGELTGTLAAGETVTITTVLTARAEGFGFEYGARAWVGDPNDLSVASGGTLNVSAVPVPAAAWLFASGLLGLAAVARRKTG